MTIKKCKDRKPILHKSKYENIITKKMLEEDMYELKMSQRAIAAKYNIGKGTVQHLQFKYKMEMLNLFERRVPRSFTYEQKQLIYGTAIADGHIFRKNKNRHGALSIKHSVKQMEFIDLKYEMLKDFVRTKPTIQVSWIGDKKYKCKSFRTLTHDFFTYLHKALYIENNEGEMIKTLNRSILEKIDEPGLAIMYMDYGTVHHKCRDFCFECFSKEEQQMFCDWLKEKYDLKARVIKYGEKFRTRIYTWNEFDEIVEPFIIESMKYKIQKN